MKSEMIKGCSLLAPTCLGVPAIRNKPGSACSYDWQYLAVKARRQDLFVHEQHAQKTISGGV